MDLQFTPQERAFRYEVQVFLRAKLPAETAPKVKGGLHLTKQHMARRRGALNEDHHLSGFIALRHPT